MKILFPNHPLKARQPDPEYQSEFDGAVEAGFVCELYDLENLRAGDPWQAVRCCADATRAGEQIIHRGWMMSEALFAALFEVLVKKGYSPFTTPDQYSQAHYLPNAYPILEGRTPESVWVVGGDADAAWLRYAQLGQPAAIVKDFVKSAKHLWNEACFIPAGTRTARFREIVTRFVEVRGKQFEKGIVLRRFHHFVKTYDNIAGQLVDDEYRLFMLNGRLLAGTPARSGSGPFERLKEWEFIADKFSNRFISMDIACERAGGWVIVEVGDGGVSGLPQSIEPKKFFRSLRDALDSGMGPNLPPEASVFVQ